MRALFFILGVLSLGAAWLGPLPKLAERAFFAHMTLHMMVVGISAPLLALGVARSSWDPVPAFPRLFSPIGASVLEGLVVWGWHAPALHHAARHSPAGFAAEQAMFLGVSLCLWLSAMGGKSGRDFDRDRVASGVFALLWTSMHMTLLGALLALTPRALYSHHSGFGSLTALEDQQLGGAIMIAAGGASYLFGGLGLATRLLRDPAIGKEGKTA